MAFDNLIPTLTPEENVILREYLDAKSAPKGSLIIKIDDIKQDLFFLLSGHFEVYKKIVLAKQMVAVKVASLNAPVLFGETNFLLEHRRTAAILVSEDAKYFLLGKEKFEKLKAQYPQIAIKILEHIGKMTSTRFIEFEQHIHKELIHNSTTAEEALENMNKHIGPAHICSKEIAQKLFNLESKFEEIRDGTFKNHESNH